MIELDRDYKMNANPGKFKISSIYVEQTILKTIRLMKKKKIIASMNEYIRMAILERLNKDLEVLKVIYK